MLTKSLAAFEKAKQVIPGGVNSPVRSFRSVGGTPPFIKQAQGSKIYDIDDNEYIDYVLSYGPQILGHVHPTVVEAIQAASLKGTSYGAPTLAETKLAELICDFVPSIEMVRMVNSGTEATMSALRLARAYTKREYIVKFEGCYHGHHDSLLVKAGSGALTLGVPDSPGVPASIAGNTLTIPYNDVAALENLLQLKGSEIAGLIIEPTPGNMGLVLPNPGYLQAVRELTAAYGVVLIFDEVMSGFRSSEQSSQGLYAIEPDLTCLGKVIGGGLPVACYGGKKEIMQCVAPLGGMYQAGTLSGNPLAMAAGIATLEYLKAHKICAQAAANTENLVQGLRQIIAELELPCTVNSLGSMFTLFFTKNQVTDFASACTSDLASFKIYFHAMLEQGIYLPPSQFETCFMSSAHSQEDIAQTLSCMRLALTKVKANLA